jgi:hypothetical protein
MRHGERHIRSFCKKNPSILYSRKEQYKEEWNIFQLQVLCWTKIKYENCISLGWGAVYNSL